MMKQSEVSASYNDALTKLMSAIGRNFLTNTPEDAFNLFTSFVQNGLPEDLDIRIYRNIFPHLELFMYWSEVNSFIKGLKIVETTNNN